MSNVRPLRSAGNAPPLSFREWLRQFEAEQSAIGDLARDVRADPEWPDGSDPEEYVHHLWECDASDAALDALGDAIERYQGLR